MRWHLQETKIVPSIRILLVRRIQQVNKQITIFREETTSVLSGFHAGPLSWSNWNLEMLVFVEGEKLENPEKNPQSKARIKNKLNRHIWHRVRRALSPLRHPCSPGTKGEREIHAHIVKGKSIQETQQWWVNLVERTNGQQTNTFTINLTDFGRPRLVCIILTIQRDRKFLSVKK